MNFADTQGLGNDVLVFLTTEPITSALEITSATEAGNQATTSERIFNLIKSGSFAFAGREVKAAFEQAGGKDASGLPTNKEAIVNLCMDIVAFSHRSCNAAQHIKLWFNPFTGRLHLTTGAGTSDCLTIWTALSRQTA